MGIKKKIINVNTERKFVEKNVTQCNYDLPNMLGDGNAERKEIQK